MCDSTGDSVYLVFAGESVSCLERFFITVFPVGDLPTVLRNPFEDALTVTGRNPHGVHWRATVRSAGCCGPILKIMSGAYAGDSTYRAEF